MSAIIEARSSSAAEEREWELRRDMAAVFRVAAREGWNEQIGNHNSLMLPDEKEPRFLINPRGYLFQELKASIQRCHLLPAIACRTIKYTGIIFTWQHNRQSVT